MTTSLEKKRVGEQALVLSSRFKDSSLENTVVLTTEDASSRQQSYLVCAVEMNSSFSQVTVTVAQLDVLIVTEILNRRL